ncbi:testis-expressed protein 11 isoform X2 [Anolis carolinensis]|uniref:testis-expressed protein 11 isoform X2 n=1 Tax=Anolis carolinensis TaxID=28377 RepID=UPI0002C89B75|nr:PREDICTED: testis-expressed sequence 11 protein isoform X2 [Anolis carolinensis]|eukprot:XP_008121014.1 PREDICTED: testis-expressed sequence 11 protein isoform X2 [Anolis carolinensis]
MEIKELIQKLMSSKASSDVQEDTEKLFGDIEKINKGSVNEREKAQFEESAVNLWNWTVARKEGPVLSDIQKVKLRHVACRMMLFCEVNDPPEEMARRQILMAMKTGKGWVDTGEPALANEVLDIAMNTLETLYAQLTKRSTRESDIHAHKADIEKDVFKVLSYQAESAMAQGDFQKTTTCIQRCKDILMRLPNEASYLSLLCYNFGVETYQRKNYEQSSFWLSQSYEIGKMDVKYSTGKEMQAKVLRLLATVYLEWDCRQYHDKALRAAAMANEEDLHPAGFLLKLKILLKGGASDEDVGTAVAELIHHKLPLDIYLDSAKLLLEYKREAIGFDFLKSVARLFEDTPDVGRVILLHIKLLLQRMKEPLAKRMIEDILAGQTIGKQLPSESLNHLHLVLWDRAAQNYEAKSYSEALQWYNYSLGFYSSGQMDHQNLAKLHRNMAACYLQLQDHDKAHKAIKEAESYDPSSIFTQFYVYKIAVLEHNTQKALDAFVAMEKSIAEPTHHKDKALMDGSVAVNLISLAAQFALENGEQEVAIEVLGYLSMHLQDCQQVFTALKCLIRLTLSKAAAKPEEETDMENLLRYLTTAYDRLDRIFRDESKMLEMRVSEAQWFRKIAWNLAVQCENCPRIMRDFFIMSFKFSQLCPSDKGTLLAQRTCLLMAAAVDLDIARKSSLPDDQIQLLRQALERIQSCREIWKFLKQTGDFPKDPTDTILLLYEFEARAKLSDPTVADLLDQMWELSQVDIKMLETMAALAMESPAHYPSVCKKALKMVLTLLRQHEALDTVTFSKCLHSLVHLSLPSGIIEAGTHTLEEAWGYFEDALSILGSVVQQADYPEVEILWLMTQAWNTGIYQYCAGKYPEAERWCGLGMRFLAHLGTLKSNYENQMVGLYSEVLDKLDRAKGFQLNKEL